MPIANDPARHGAVPRHASRCPVPAPAAATSTDFAADSPAPAAALTASAVPTMLEEVRVGLSRRQKELPPKFFYDARGSALFDEITRLPEYYLTRAEREILERCAPELVGDLRPHTLVELGAGSAEKTRVILDAMRSAGCAETYVPVDVSADFLDDTARRLRVEYPGLRVAPVVADLERSLDLPAHLPHPVLFAFLGSTIGNFDVGGAVALLRRVRGVMAPFDRFLVGFDLRKSRERVERAYNDPGGVTADFNRNSLRVVNRELGADFVPDDFDHRAFYDAARHRIEMHLVAVREQLVTVPGIGDIILRRGETIRTEISCKYDRDSIVRLLHDAGLALETLHTDAAGEFALAIAAPVP